MLVIGEPPSLQVPSSIVRVFPELAVPKMVGSPVFEGCVLDARISKLLVTDEAATYVVPLTTPPAASAVMVQVPVANFVTVDPETVHLLVVDDEKVTVCPELLVAVSEKVPEAPT